MKLYSTNDMIAAARENGYKINFSGLVIEKIKVEKKDSGWIFIEADYYHDHCCSSINGPSRIGSIFYQKKPSGAETLDFYGEGEKWFKHFGHTVENCLTSWYLNY